MTAIASRDTARRLLVGFAAGALAAVCLAGALAALGPGNPVTRAVFAGLLVPLLWLVFMLRALVGGRPRRTALEAIGVALAVASAALLGRVL